MSLVKSLLVFLISFPSAASRKDGDPSLELLMKSLKSNIDSRRGKNVDILLISEEVKGSGTMISVSELKGSGT